MKTTSEMEMINVSRLIPYVNNARTHSEDQITKLRSSLREFGFVNPILIDREYNVIAGHGRLAAAKAENFTEVPCVYVDHLTEAQKKAYILADNRMAEDAGWDEEMLRVEIEALQEQAFDLSLTGFDDAEIAGLFADEDAEDDNFDEEAALEAQAFVQPGDVWIIGRHRLMCGDSTKAKDVSVLMDGKKANLCITDPPFNCDIEGGTGMKIMNDKWDDGKKFYEFLLSTFRNVYDSLVDGGAFYCFHSDAEKVNFYNATVDAGFHYSTTCIWVKNALVIGRMDYQMRHEPIIYAFKDTAKHKFYGDRKQTTVWEFDRPTRSKLHPTSKTLPLISYPMRMSSMENSIVMDLFGGSGSTLMAAEQLNRIAFLMELDPMYASAIVRRYAAAKQGTDDVFVVRDGEKLPCSAVYIPTEEDLALKEDKVNICIDA
ncbi:MAG: site-specific DNA-methyltransferase [Clostridia bacterium]|nr:site-specific DNA-methyltransferase [Clostridia bacterium]